MLRRSKSPARFGGYSEVRGEGRRMMTMMTTTGLGQIVDDEEERANGLLPESIKLGYYG